MGDDHNSVLLHLLPLQYRIDGKELALPQEEVSIKPIFSVSSIDEATARAAAFEIRTVGEIKSYNGISYLDCIDPEGNVIQISER